MFFLIHFDMRLT